MLEPVRHTSSRPGHPFPPGSGNTMNRSQLLILISSCDPSKRETRLFNPVDVKVADPLGGDTKHQELMRDMRGAMWDLRPPPNPSEEAGVDNYLYYLASTEVLASLTMFPRKEWARQPTGDPSTDLVKVTLWKVIRGADATSWRRRWDDTRGIG
jgi:hypothetical protein